MFSTLLIPTDLSTLSERVVECACGMVPFGARSIILLHALGLRHLESMAPALAEMVEPALRQQAAALAQTGLPVEQVIKPGLAHVEICKMARERDASVIVLGSRGSSILSELKVGAVTLDTLRGCTVPLLFAPAAKPAGDACTPCRPLARRILHPTDFSDVAERAFASVRALVQRGIEGVTLLHVQDQARIEGRGEAHRLPEFDELDRARLERLARDLKAAGAKYVHTEIAHGSPMEEILSRSAESPESLVVMGTQGRSLLPEVFLGSVSHAVARRSSAPVLLVPGASARKLQT